MKKYLVLIVAAMFCNLGYAQLNMGGDQIVAQIQVKKDLQVLGKLEDLDHLFVPLDSLKFYDNDPRFNWNENIVGYKFYCAHSPNSSISGYESSMSLGNRYLCENPKDSTICIKQLPVGYYEVVGIIRYQEQMNKYIEHLNQLKWEKDSNLIGRDDKVFSEIKAYMLKSLISTSAFEKKVKLEDPPHNFNSGQLFYIIKDSNTQEIYYIPRNSYLVSIKGDEERFRYNYSAVVEYKMRYGERAYYTLTGKLRVGMCDIFGCRRIISIPYYDNIVKGLKGQFVSIYLRDNAFEDYVTKQLIDNIFIKNPNIDGEIGCYDLSRDDFNNIVYAKCVDIFIHDDFNICGLFEVEGSKFTLPIGYFLTRVRRVYEPKHGERIEYDFPFFKTHGNKNDYQGHFITKNTVNEVIALLKEVELLAAQKQAQEEAERKQAEAEYARLKAERKAQYQKKLEEEKQRKMQWRVDMINKYGEKYGQAIIEGKVMLGMSPKMCEESWGIPIDKFNTTTVLGTTSTWLYNYKTSLHFVNEKLMKIEN